MSATPDVVPVPLDISAAMRKAFRLGQTYWQQSDSDFVSQHKKSDVTLESFNVLAAEAQATADALQARIDELETQLFIATAEPALSLFEQLGLAALPAFPSVRINQIESKS